MEISLTENPIPVSDIHIHIHITQLSARKLKKKIIEQILSATVRNHTSNDKLIYGAV